MLLKLFTFFKQKLERRLEKEMRKKFGYDPTVRFYNPISTLLRGNVKIGAGTYINSGRCITGENSKITIGENCAIGHNVTISSITHDIDQPTGPTIIHKEADIFIGSDVWIGSNVFIKEGISIGDGCIIGANSVVTKSFEGNSIIAGVPAKLIN